MLTTNYFGGSFPKMVVLSATLALGTALVNPMLSILPMLGAPHVSAPKASAFRFFANNA